MMGKVSGSFFGYKNRRAGARCQFGVTGHEIGMGMRQKDPFQSEMVLLQIVYVAIHVPFRIDDDGFIFCCNDVRRVRQTGNKKSFNVHRWYFLAWLVRCGRWPAVINQTVISTRRVAWQARLRGQKREFEAIDRKPRPFSKNPEY